MDKVEKSKEKLDALMKERKTIEEKISSINEQVKELNPQRIEAKNIFDAKKTAAKNKSVSLRRIVNDFNRTTQEMTQIQERVDEIR